MRPKRSEDTAVVTRRERVEDERRRPPRCASWNWDENPRGALGILNTAPADFQRTLMTKRRGAGSNE